MKSDTKNNKPHEEFGKLVRMLREDIGWSRKTLSEKTGEPGVGVPESVIENIEKGEKANYEIDYLVKLADGLELTSMERREFFLAAITDADAGKLVRPRNETSARIHPDPYKTRDELILTAAELRIPAFVSDVYCDIIAANAIIIKFLEIEEKILSAMKDVPGGLNTMNVVFSDIANYRNRMNDIWERSMWINMRQFRRNTFRYRGKIYYEKIKTILKNVGRFHDYWKSSHQSIPDHYVDLDHMKYIDKESGIEIHYVTTRTIALTEFGELYLVSYLPANLETEELFSKLAKAVDEEAKLRLQEKNTKNSAWLKVEKLAPWPEKDSTK